MAELRKTLEMQNPVTLAIEPNNLANSTCD